MAKDKLSLAFVITVAEGCKNKPGRSAWWDGWAEARAGKRVFVRISAMKDGFKSAPVQVEALVAGHGA